MKKIVIYPGGFQPFHEGHLSSYLQAKKQFPDADFYVVASGSIKERPIPYDDKRFLALQAGVNADDFPDIVLKSPMAPKEILDRYNPEQDVFILVRSERDPVSYTRKDGSPGYYQPYSTSEKNLQPFGKNGYVFVTKKKPFKINGNELISGTQVRDMYKSSDDQSRMNMIQQMYPNSKEHVEIKKILDRHIANQVKEQIVRLITQAAPYIKEANYTQQKKFLKLLENAKKIIGSQQPKLATVAVKMLDAGILDDSLTEQEVEEATLINDPEQGHLIVPDGGMGTWDEKSLLSNLIRKFSSMAEMIKEKRYSNLYHSLYEAGVVENMLKALVQYENFKEKQGNRPIAKGREIDISESTDYISEK